MFLSLAPSLAALQALAALSITGLGITSAGGAPAAPRENTTCPSRRCQGTSPPPTRIVKENEDGAAAEGRLHDQAGAAREGGERDRRPQRRVLRQVRGEVDDPDRDEGERQRPELGDRRQAALAQLASLVMITSVATCIAPVMAAA